MSKTVKLKTEKYRDSNRAWYNANKDEILERRRQLYQANKESIREKQKEYRRINRAKISKKYIEKYRHDRDKFLDMYGGKCVCCGESEKCFLVLEHVYPQRNRAKGKKREGAAESYRKAVKVLDTSKYTILCHNCNFATRLGDICPHKKSRKED